jgi:hypothetical protein
VGQKLLNLPEHKFTTDFLWFVFLNHLLNLVILSSFTEYDFSLIFNASNTAGANSGVETA